MNTKRSILSATLIAALSAGTWGLQGQEDKPNYRQGKDRNEFRTKAEIEGQTTSGRLGKFHKASKLVGMNVKNHADESLGEIKELVVDLESGRISYVVLGVGGILGIGERYIAIPPSAFNYSADGDQLVLNADKSKVEQAPSFNKDNWPDVENPAWGAYWGAKATERQQTDRFQGRDSDRLPARQLPGQQPQQDRLQPQDRLGGQEQTFKGEIISINPEARTMTVKGDTGTQVFTIEQTAMLKLKDVLSGRLSDLKVGDQVNVKFRKHGDGAGMAYSIESAEQR